MTKVPLPRYDLVPFREYAMGCVQTSRGCPFQCEFCDIIVIFGRRPRIKTPEQVVAEIDAQHRLGARVIFLVDDNFIGNKKAAKEILRAIIDWQQQHGYPLAFFTEASLDLAEDDELMRLMTEAGLVAVFIGIESPDEEALRETKKYQNVRGSLVERVHKVQDARPGGLRRDDRRLRQRRRRPSSTASSSSSSRRGSSARWPACSRRSPRRRSTTASRPRAGSTTRRPTTPSIATNVIPLLMTRETLRDGWLDLMDRLYDAGELLRAVRRPLHRGPAPAGHGQDELAPPAPAAVLPEDPGPDDPRRARACWPASGPTRGPGPTARSTPVRSASSCSPAARLATCSSSPGSASCTPTSPS